MLIPLSAPGHRGLIRRDLANIVTRIAHLVQATVAGAKKPPRQFAIQIAVHDERVKTWLEEPDMTIRQIWRLPDDLGHSFSERSVNRAWPFPRRVDSRKGDHNPHRAHL
jgi:hypothetical protein